MLAFERNLIMLYLSYLMEHICFETNRVGIQLLVFINSHTRVDLLLIAKVNPFSE